MDTPTEPFNVISLCTGYGGLDIGLGEAVKILSGGRQRATALVNVEVESFPITNMVNKMEAGAMDPVPIWTDIKTFPAGIFRGAANCITAGYPCQPFSCAGKRQGDGDPRHLWPYVRETIRTVGPEWVFLENVEGHLSKGVVQVLADLEKMAYTVGCGVFSAEEVGAPHRRKRVFILAHRERTERGPQSHPGQCVTNWHDSGRKETSSGPAVCGPELADPRGGELDRVSESEGRQPNRAVRDSGQELGHSQSDDQRRESILTMHGQGVASGGPGGTELADTECRRGKQPLRDFSEEPNDGGEKLAEPRRQGLQGPKSKSIQRSRRRLRRGTVAEFHSPLWPARPGEPQHDWEQPRVLADSPNTDRWAGEASRQGSQGQRRGVPADQSERQVKFGLGRVFNGLTYRVDRLRLLGNGVVPQTATKAFITLYWRLCGYGG